MDPNSLAAFVAILPAVVTGVFAVVGTLGGVLLAQVHAARQAKEARRLADRDDVAKLLASLIVTSMEWVSRMEVMVVAYSRFEHDDLLEFGDTDSGKAMGRCNEELHRLFAEAVLRLGDPELSELVGEAYRLHRDAPEAFARVLPGERRRTGAELSEDIVASLRYVYGFRNVIQRLQAVARPMVGVSIKPPVPRKYLPWRDGRWTGHGASSTSALSRTPDAPGGS